MARRRVTGDTQPRVVGQQAGYSGGMVAEATRALGPEQARSIVNGRVTDRGAVEKRGGWRALTAPVAAPASAYMSGLYYRIANQWLVARTVKTGATYTTTLYRGTIPSTPESGAITWTSVGSWTMPETGGHNPARRPSFETFLPVATSGLRAERCYIADGASLTTYDPDAAPGSQLTRLATGPSVSRLAVYNGRLFGILDAPNAANMAASNVLYWSSLTDGTSLGVIASGGGFATVNRDGGHLTGLAVIGRSLLIFQQGAISQFTGITLDDINVASGTQGVSSTVGTTWADSIVAIHDRAYFCNPAGVFVATEGGVEQLGANPLEDYIRANPLAAISPVTYLRGEHHQHRGEIWWYTGQGADAVADWTSTDPSVDYDHRTIYVFNYVLNCWYTFVPGPSGFRLAASFLAQGPGFGERLIAIGGSETALEVYMTEVAATEDDAPGGAAAKYALAVTTRPLDADDPTTEKQWRDAYVTVDASAAPALRVTAAGPGVTTLTSDPSMADFVARRPVRVPLGLRATELSLTLTETPGSESATGLSFGAVNLFGVTLRRY